MGHAPHDVDRIELWQAYALLGQHRHPDYWTAGHDPEPAGHKDRSGRPLRSGRDSNPLKDSSSLFEQRRAHARGEGPKPVPRPTAGNSPVIARLQG